nr:hypothetical protein CFP56_69462 [Quercus suber]
MYSSCSVVIVVVVKFELDGTAVCSLAKVKTGGRPSARHGAGSGDGESAPLASAEAGRFQALSILSDVKWESSREGKRQELENTRNEVNKPIYEAVSASDLFGSPSLWRNLCYADLSNSGSAFEARADEPEERITRRCTYTPNHIHAYTITYAV